MKFRRLSPDATIFKYVQVNAWLFRLRLFIILAVSEIYNFHFTECMISLSLLLNLKHDLCDLY